MAGNTITVAGIEIPSNSPIFLTIVGFHFLVAFVCVVTGPVAMLSGKGPRTASSDWDRLLLVSLGGLRFRYRPLGDALG